MPLRPLRRRVFRGFHRQPAVPRVYQAGLLLPRNFSRPAGVEHCCAQKVTKIKAPVVAAKTGEGTLAGRGKPMDEAGKVWSQLLSPPLQRSRGNADLLRCLLDGFPTQDGFTMSCFLHGCGMW